MSDFDVICLSSDSSRPSSPFINVSDVFNNSEKNEYLNVSGYQCCENLINPYNGTGNSITPTGSRPTPSPLKLRADHSLSESDTSENESKCGNKETTDRANFLEVEARPTSYEPDLLEKNVGSLNYQKNNGIKKLTKDERLKEKARKQREKELKREEKLALKRIQDQIKPKNCMKFMSVSLDSTLINCSFGRTLIATIHNSEATYTVSNHQVPLTVCWTREMPGPNIKEENDLVVIWQWELVIPAIKNHKLCSLIQEIRCAYPNKSIFLVIYGLNAYFSQIKRKTRGNVSEPSNHRKRKSDDSKEIPYVTRKEIEEELIELQMLENCNHRLIESAEDLAQFIVQITKAIAETPFKLDKQKRELETLEWFAVGDSRDCVTVNQAGHGLLRLWQQQLCQFNLAGHDVAQAIASVYPSPVSLMQAFDNCKSQKEAEELLKDIPVRRCQGPLATSRRIGPELSKKIHTFFCSADGDAPLSQDQ